MNSIELDSEDIMNDTKIKSNTETLQDTLNQKSGIYKIINKLDGKYYVGSTKDFNKRWRTHKYKLIRGIHKNQKLQNAWNKYGESNFEMIICKYIEPDRTLLLMTEQQYLNEASVEKDICYNLIFDATGGTLEQNSIEKIRQKANGRKASFTARKKMSEKRHTEESKKHLREINLGEKNHFYGKTHTAETKNKIRELAKSRYYVANNNPNYDNKLYYFINDITHESFTGTRYDFCKKFSLNRTTIADLIYGRRMKTKSGWRLDTHQ
jgi:group I intron endonuclease